MKKNFLFLLVSVVLLLAIPFTSCSQPPSPAAPTGTSSSQASSGAPSSTLVPSNLVTASGKLLPYTTAQLSFEQGGVISEVLVKAGDTIAVGDVIARLQGVKTVQADLAAAQTQYDQTLTQALAVDKANRSKDIFTVQTSGFTLPTWYYDQQEQLDSAQATADNALVDWNKLKDKLAVVMKTSGADFILAETNLSNAQSDFQVAKNLKDRIKNGKKLEDLSRRQLYELAIDNHLQSKGLDPRWVTVDTLSQDLRDQAQNIYDDANQNLKDMQKAYDDAISTDSAKQVLKARAQASIAQERYYSSLDYVRALQTGTQSQTIKTASDALNKIKATMDLFELRSPIAGTIQSISLKVGEMASPGVPAVFVADTTNWTVETKDLAEIDIARVALGQDVSIKLDALPGEEFPAKVTAIDPVGKEYLGDMTYKVTVTINKADPRFKWNMTATVNIRANQP